MFAPTILKAFIVAAVVAAVAPVSHAQHTPQAPKSNPNCRNTGNFDAWLAAFRKEALASGISARTVSRVLDNMTMDPGVISRDRKQGFFAQGFIAFSSKLISQGRIQNGRNRMSQYRDVFARAEKKYGVPAAVITAFWGLESDYGSFLGNLPILRSLTTLAYDCRRGEMFRTELLDALRIVDRGDLTPEEMVGAWAGEIGQTQFLPSHYLNHAVDFDGDGRRNLISSVPDVIGSSAKFLQHLGWKAGQPWLEEVRVPSNLQWDQADLAVQHPRSKWAEWGVTRRNGEPLQKDALPASLLLPMGRFGPAFLGYDNFQIYLKWNQSLNYCITAAYLATRLEGAPAFNKGSRDIPELTGEQTKELQQLLVRRGYDVGEIDGKLGAATRASVKSAQLKLGLPADSFPTEDLIERLRGR
jgi:lytic murein transglycosylase